jgi:hypothetical protein
MARRKVREYVEEVPADSPAGSVNAELAEQQIPDAEIDEIFRMTDELRSTAGIVCQILRKLPPHLAGYCGEITPGEFSLERVRKTYGPGKYAVRLKGPLGYVKGGGTLDIAPLPEGTAVPAHESRDSAAAIIEALDKRSEARGSELKSWAQILAPLLIPVVGVWLKPRENQVTELVQGLAALKGLSPDPPKPEGLESQLDRILGVMDKLKEAQGAGQSSTGATWVDIVRDGISALKGPAEVLAGRLMSPPGLPALPPMPMITAPTPFGPTSAPAVSAAPIQPTGTVAPGSAPPSAGHAAQPANGGSTVGVVSFLPWLRDNLQALIYQAGRNKDPGLYASVMLDNLPPGTDPALLKGFIERADWWTQLQTFAPGVTPYPAWFAEFREAVIEIMNEPEEPPPAGDAPAQPVGNSDEPAEPFT